MLASGVARDWLRDLHANTGRAFPRKSSPYGWRHPFGLPAFVRDETSVADEPDLKVQALKPSGTHEFGVKDSLVRVGNSGVTLTVTDLTVPLDDREVMVGTKKYVVPNYTKVGAATINGTEEADRITVRQNDDGDTLVEVDYPRGKASVNLGRIAGLTLNGLGGDDTLKVSADDYYGGVVIEGGAGDDTVEAEVTNALKRAVRIGGGAGEDELTLSGAALSAVIEGGAGADKLTAAGLAGEREFMRTLSGGAGGDVIYGSPGADTLEGDSGNDALFGGAGDDELDGDAGNDVLYGQLGDDTLLGGDDIDLLLGGKGDDIIKGGAGADELQGEAGDDRLRGGDGDDAIYAGSGNDSLQGGDGADTLAPLAWSSNAIQAYERVGDYLRVLVRDVEYAQERVTDPDYWEPGGDNKYLYGYDADEDYLVDENRLVP